MFSSILALLGLGLGSLPLALAKVQFLGVAIAGGDFGCQIDGSCPTGSVQLPLDNGPNQMQHFVKNDGINLLRLPTSWQFLVNNNLGGDLDATNLAKYDQLMQACLATGAHCMIDVHNFARYDGKIIGQGGPTDAQFAALWSALATKYASEDRVVFELMNEPHDLDIDIWAQTCQAAVTAIRNAGATSQMILLPGSNFDSAATLVSGGSAAALMKVTNPDGSTDGLLLDIHKYLDIDNSGTHAACTTDNTEAFGAVAQFLRQNGRKGLVSETGASSDASCFTSFCTQNALINANADVFVGLVGWAAGSFDTSYILSLTPSGQGNALVDKALMTQCLLGTWNNSTTTTTNPATTSSAPSNATAVLTLPTTLVTATGTPTPATGTGGSETGGSSTLSIIDTTALIVLSTMPPDLMTGSLAVATGTPTPGSRLVYATDGTYSFRTRSTAAASGTSAGAEETASASASSTPFTAGVGGGRNRMGGMMGMVWCWVVGLMVAGLVW
ncbi:glycoside hydrolase superfamily [Biscogniauxia mediterranea]|nr:glycoside hydrolase superfamily [Biscogniauxia mediterranea]